MHPKLRLISTWLCISIAATIVGCEEESEKILPGSTGKAGEVVLVIDAKYWSGALGDHIKSTLSREHVALPQPEPLFSVVPIPHSTFKGLFITHRNVLIFNIGPNRSEGIIAAKNEWATSQVVVTVSASSEAQCIALLKKDEQKLERILIVAERNRLRQKFKSIGNKELAAKLKGKFGIELNVPPDYVVGSEKDNFIWFTKETPQISQGIFIYLYPKGEGDLDDVDRIIAMRDTAAKYGVPGPADGSYMGTMAEYPAITKLLDFSGTPAIETRGLWDVKGDYMGGPFISLSFQGTDKNTIICIDGYVYAPKYDKRNYLRQLEAILYSLKFGE